MPNPGGDANCGGLPRHRRAAGERRQLMPHDAAAARQLVIAADLPALKVATYNIHTCVGIDRRHDPARIAAVLREIDADIVSLQEVDAKSRFGRQFDQWAFLAAATGRNMVPSGASRQHRGRFGNAILSRFPALSVRSIDLSIGGYEPRSAIDVDLLVGDRVLRVVGTHFGLRAGERQLQANRLLAALAEPLPAHRPRAAAILVMGDLNEWRGQGGSIRALDRRLGESLLPRSFPSWLPVLPLDRIYAGEPAALRDVAVYRSPLARVASDHLPVVAEFCWSGPQAPNGVAHGASRAPRRKKPVNGSPTAAEGAAVPLRLARWREKAGLAVGRGRRGAH
jgi:endonuclease/exonuclease/phosphatase family metal-dependent hydrolase